MAQNSFRNPSVMRHDFSMVPSVNIQRSVFNRSSGFKTTFDSGYLVPFFVDEALPGDTFNLRTSLIARLTTPIVPIMDNMKLDYFFFAVPYRLVWDNWERFNGAQTNPGDSVDYLIPTVAAPAGGFGTHSIADYFGIPTNVSGIEVNALPFRAYNLIYNEWFRDENLIDSVPVPVDDGDDDFADFKLLRRGKRHDYFTSCLPWPQKGDGVELSLGSPTVSFSDTPFSWKATNVTNPDNATPSFTFNPGFVGQLDLTPSASDTTSPREGVTWGNEVPALSSLPNDDAYVIGWNTSETNPAGITISNADALTINSLREAFQLQRLLERDARGGTRYTEIIRSHFGVISPDARLQRPEYLGGGSFDVNISPVLQTSSTDGTTPQGNLAAFGLSTGVRHGFSHSFTEHCFIIGLCSVRADLTYQQGIPRMFSRRTRFDHYWPALAHLGEQGVLNKEIYAQGPGHINPDTGIEFDEEVFGYQERFAEYRYSPSKITGKMRSSDPQSLDVWHLSQSFDSLPKLNQEFIEENPPVERVVAVTDEPQFLMDCFFDLKCARPMPVYSVPGYIDHF